MIETKQILEDVNAERTRQDDQWGGPEHDDLHNSHDWIAIITKHLGKAVMWPWDASKFRQQMVRIAAISVAAIAWHDRTFDKGEQDVKK